MLRVGVIGVGNIGRTHLKAYQELAGECTIVGLCDIYPAHAEEKKAELGLDVPVFAEYTDLLASVRPDLVSVCTPPNTHASITIGCLGTGVNVVVEKPMAPSLEECDAMLAAQRASGALLSVVHQNRFRADMALLKTAVDSGLVGRITHMQVNSSWWRGRPYYDLWWRGTWASEGGGCTLNHAVHHVDLALWLAGRPSSVTAVLANAAHDNSEVEDLSIAVLELDRGLVAITASVVDHGEEQSIVIHGEHARVSQPWKVVAEATQPNGFPLPGGNPEVVTQLEALAAAQVPPAREGHLGLLADVVAAVRDHRAPAVTGEDGRAAIELITAIYESGTEHARVELPLTPDDPYYQAGRLPGLAHHFFAKEKAIEDLGGFILVEGSPDPAQRP